MHLKKQLGIALSVILLVSAFAAAEDIGTYRVPVQSTYAGTTIAPGSYKISIEQGTDGPTLALSKNGSVVASDLAIVIPAKSAGQKSVQIAKIAGQNFLRIRVRSESNWYYAYLETAK